MKSASNEETSLLAFLFDKNGKPAMVARFVDDKDKLALLSVAGIQIKRLLREAEKTIRVEDATLRRKTPAQLS